jgi:hypothetical protein
MDPKIACFSNLEGLYKLFSAYWKRSEIKKNGRTEH